MKKTAYLLLLTMSVLAVNSRAATLQIPVVASFENLENEKLWKDIDQDEVPLNALQMREIQVPSRADSKVFLQNERMIVCYESCSQAQPALPVANGKIELKDLDANKFIGGHKRDEAWKAVKLLNVYYWTNKLFDYLETLGYKPSRRLTVIVERNISDPSAGEGMTNNAFFTELDWSLNFLPAKNSIVYKVMGMNIHSAALDPSVAMHECTHSVFQDLIGSILNPSLFGLHEALADYFAMAVLDTRKIGIIFFSGKPIRSAADENEAKKAVYKPGLEAHDLGNIVNTALQHIRQVLPQKRFADLVALETVKELGQEPYITATQIQATFMDSLNAVARSQGQSVSPEVLTKVAAVWKAYNIQSPRKPEPIPASRFGGSVNTAGYFEVTTETKINEKAAADWHMPAVTSIKSGIMNTVVNADKTKLMYVEVEDASVSVPMYLHYSEDGLVGAYDLGGQLILPKNPDQKELFEKLVSLNKVIKGVMDIANRADNAGTMLGSLFEGGQAKSDEQKMVRGVYKMKNQQVTQGTMTLPGPGTIHVIKRTGTISTTILGKVLNVLAGGQIGMTDSITVYTVKAAQVPQLKTQELFPGERFLGYEVVLKTGVVQKVVISDFDGNPGTSVLAAPAK